MDPNALAALGDAVPPGRNQLEPGEAALLGALTAQLAAQRPGATDEYERFQTIAKRAIRLPQDATAHWLAGKRVLVTGGTGCIGTLVAEQVAGFRPARLVSVARGVAAPERPVAGVEYLIGDVRDRDGLFALFDRIRPDVVLHLAAQREPGLAETEVHRTLATNIFGTRNVLEAAAFFRVPDTVITSTGKALRPYSRDIYAASKRVAEWLTARAARAGGGAQRRISAVRFTHVADNSIIAERLRQWCAADEVIRLHGAQIEFYVQSGIEAAQLLLAAGIGARAGMLRINALRDLDWPVQLLDLALGMRAQARSAAPVYIAGYESGYESSPFPALYDPLTAGDVSPLINAFEAPVTVPGLCDQVDAFDAPALSDDAAALDLLGRLDEACAQTEDPAVLRPLFDRLCRALLDATLADVSDPAAARALHFAQAGPPIDAAHQPMLDALRRRVAAVSAA